MLCIDRSIIVRRTRLLGRRTKATRQTAPREPLEARSEDSAQALRNCLKIIPKLGVLTAKRLVGAPKTSPSCR
jgi:hypothetical protein